MSVTCSRIECTLACTRTTFTFLRDCLWFVPVFVDCHPPGASSPRGLTFTWWGCCGLRLGHKPTELGHSFLFCSCVCFSLYDPFNCISFHKFFRQLSVFLLCSSDLNSALLVLSTIYLFLKVSLSLDIIPRSWELRTHRLKSHQVRTQSLNVLPLKPGVCQYIAIYATLTAKDFFLAYFYPSSPFTGIFSKHLPIFPVLAVANTWFGLQNTIGHPAGCRFPC